MAIGWWATHPGGTVHPARGEDRTASISCITSQPMSSNSKPFKNIAISTLSLKNLRTLPA